MAKLLLIEGLPGTGKSTFADALVKANPSIRFYSEISEDHPVDLHEVAWLNPHTEEFLQIPRNELTTLHNWEEGLLVSYRKSKHRERLQTFDAYELPFDQHVSIMLKRWKAFVEDVIHEDTTYLFECAFLQNPFTIGMISQNVDPDAIASYVKSVAGIIAPLNPFVFYLSHEDVQTSFYEAYDERDKGWQQGFVDYYTNRAYGKAHGLFGKEGTVQVMLERKRRELGVLSNLPINSHMIRNERDQSSPEELVKAFYPSL